MSKTNKIIYWGSTVWLALGLTSAGIVQLIKMEEEVEVIMQLPYPTYILTLLGIWKLLAVIAILLPKLPLLKEWAYAGIFFNMTGALYSHLIHSEGAIDLFGATLLAPILLLVLTGVSWYYRPADRKLTSKLNPFVK
ncbi:MAG: DoxX family protein [Balneolales bacterium]